QVRELSSDEYATIRSQFEAMGSGHSNIMRETGRLLSELTGTAALVVSPRADVLTLKQMRFIVTGPDELLAVLVFANGTVQNRFLRARLTEEELTRVHNLLDDVAEGRTLGELREMFARRLSSERIAYDQLRKRAFELGEAALSEVAQGAM